MKLAAILLAALSAFFLLPNGPVVQAQDLSYECGMPALDPPPASQTPAVNFGGRFVPSTGTLRVLMVWIRFPDDNETVASWPNPAVLPEWAARFVDTAYSATGDYYPGAVSGYFYEGSYGRYHVIGDVYYVTTDYDEDHYHQIAFNSGAVSARSAIELEAFNKLDAAPYNVDFSRYDNWILNRSTGFSHTQGQDNILDMCWFMTRNLHDGNYIDTRYHFNTGWAVLDCPTIVKDGITIIGGTAFPGSGVGMFEPHMYRPLNSSTATNDAYPNVNHVAHEMTHYLFGYDHFAAGGPFLSISRAGALMGPYAGGWRGHYSGYEKWRLRWLTPTVVTSNADIPLYELGSTMDTTKTKLIKIPISGSAQYYLIEYRGWTSPYEFRRVPWSAAPGMLKPGILVYLIVSEEDYLTHTPCFMQNADGMFKYGFAHDGGVSCFQLDDVIVKLQSQRFRGYHETGDIFIDGRTAICSGNKREFWYASYSPYTGNPYGGGPYLYPTNYLNPSTQGSDLQGDSLDLFQTGDVLTPWSNPGSHIWAGAIVDSFTQTTIGIEVGGFRNAKGFKWYTISCRVTNSEQLSPSKPQNLAWSGQPGQHPTFTWTANGEPDLAGYNIYRFDPTIGQNGLWVKLNSSLITTTSYTDNSVTLSGGGAPSHYEYYRVHAVDEQQLESVPSEQVDVLATGLPQEKPQASTNSVPSAFALHQNHPNPFNPSTQIRYDLPESGIVSLVVHDVLGRKVAELAGGYREAGYYTAAWNASDQASGVYFVRFTVTDGAGMLKFSKVSKLVLMK